MLSLRLFVLSLGDSNTFCCKGFIVFYFRIFFLTDFSLAWLTLQVSILILRLFLFFSPESGEFDFDFSRLMSDGALYLVLSLTPPIAELKTA
jgi:hypothetical protein